MESKSEDDIGCRIGWLVWSKLETGEGQVSGKACNRVGNGAQLGWRREIKPPVEDSLDRASSR